MRLIEIDALGNKFKFPTSKLVTTEKQIGGNKRDMRKKFIKSAYPTYSRIRKAEIGTKIYSSKYLSITDEDVEYKQDLLPDISLDLRSSYNQANELNILSNVKSYENILEELALLVSPKINEPAIKTTPSTKPKVKNTFGTFNIDSAVDFLTKNAKDKSTGYCARSIRMALEHGGINITHRPGAAYEYNYYLRNIGFKPILMSDYTGNKLPKNYTPLKGDIIVIGATKKHPYGHISMYNGSLWISDFKQRTFHGLADKYEKYTIWRHV